MSEKPWPIDAKLHKFKILSMVGLEKVITTLSAHGYRHYGKTIEFLLDGNVIFVVCLYNLVHIEILS